ncbi:cobalamin biosynthesis protein CobD [Methanohalobium evestigatum Z-7303]|uniref:Probable cobalamin biosynthesis protein CobD n=1 Tax=Methanohalobium evestigatum (strain ATCC BAA-1072 / DSM 3721 / NBRC 107634 / OCM 161 / Z-7303) TaxID=644295 RepID=D7E6B0_METEZ|nr:cobalamin biosynthesis protein [Methanohalobium evestigatum]ADI73132.1 cobalamin biosynthesis protein CobD [Methanohalobium evestigatum Z-7303]
MIGFLTPDAEFFISVLIIATVFDLLVGEPPASIHPVVWIGKFIAFMDKSSPDKSRKLYGIFLAAICIVFASAIGYIITLFTAASYIPETVAILISAYFLKSTFAIRSLITPGQDIYNDLIQNRLDDVRSKLKIFVSRDPSELNSSQMSSAVIESTSENFTDGILSPIFYYSILGPFGLVAVYAYKAVNTLDSMIGYKNDAYKELGYVSAKLDDILNWIPARISVVFIALSAFVVNIFVEKKLSIIDSLKCAYYEGGLTSSPNSGYPMAAVSGALRVKLEKPDTYTLGDSFPGPEPSDIKRVSQIIISAAIISIIIFSLIIYGIMNLIGYI